MNIKKIIYVAFGCIGTGLGAIGAIVPFIPTFPFLLMAAYCFARSSKHLHNWFIHTKLYKNNLESYVQGHGMTKKTKIRIMLMVTVLMSVGFVMMEQIAVGRVVLVCVWVFHVIYFVWGVKTLREGITGIE